MDNKKPKAQGHLYGELRLHGPLALIFALLCLIGRPVLSPIVTTAGYASSGLPLSLDSLLAAASFAITSPPGTIDLTLVDIDEELYTAWGRPCMTPRSAVASLIDAVAARRPAGIVLDVGLACAAEGGTCPTDQACSLEDFLKSYKADVPLILVREMHIARSSAATPARVWIDPSPFDAIVAANPRISWGHTFYLTDTDGTVRHWQDWWEACTTTGTETVPAMPLRVLALTNAASDPAAAPRPPLRRGDCSLEGQIAPTHMLILGDRIRAAHPERANEHTARRIPARQLLDSRYAHEDQGYYSMRGRVAIIGASHSGSADKWRTVNGYLPGLDVVANTVRFAATQLREETQRSPWRPRLQRLVVFVLLVIVSFLLRPAVAAVVILWLAVTIAAISVHVFGWLDIFESVELAGWFFVGYSLVLMIMSFVREARPYRLRRMARIALADRLRREDPECKPRD